VTIGIRITLPGVTEAQFDEVNSRIDPWNNPPKGILFHASGPVDGGWRAIDFWESREDFEAFQARIGAAVEEAGVQMQGPPQIEEFSVHETFAGR
jgi:hypothetical protein